MKQLRLFPATVLTGALAAFVIGAAVVGDVDIIPMSVKAIERIAPGELDEIALALLLVGVGLTIDLASRRARHRAEIEVRRQRVFRATITTVHDIVNNFLHQLELVRATADDQLSNETSALLDDLIRGAAAKLKALGDIEQIIETPMGSVVGITYPAPEMLEEKPHPATASSTPGSGSAEGGDACPPRRGERLEGRADSLIAAAAVHSDET